MGQLRDKIRTMVRNEFAARMVAEAKGETVYRNSHYNVDWDGMAKGKPTTVVADTATKYDFVRYVLKLVRGADKADSTEAVFLSPEQKEKALSVLEPLQNNPDKFIEKLNMERGLVFGDSFRDMTSGAPATGVRGGKWRDNNDPVAALLKDYVGHKSTFASLDKSLKAMHLDDVPEEKASAGEEEGEYDIIPGTTSKADIARMLASDPTETTTEMSVFNRVKKAMKHLSTEENSEIMDFIKDPEMEKADKISLMKNLVKNDNLTNSVAVDKYSTMFVDSMISAMKSVKDVEDDAQIDKAVLAGRKKFVEALKAAGTFSKAVNKDSINPYEINVFTHVLAQQEGRWRVLDMIMIAAKKPSQAEIFRDEAIAAAKEAFLEEMGKQTNFNSLGDFTDSLPEVKEVRANMFHTLEKRGRKAGSTKEVLAAKKAGKK